ncbi:O-antigen polymerase [Aerococcus viridans]|uniref:O-antigen polymerase n=1 Tax=Aerococcus viridans TaxID=1377 RepID=UPI003B2263DE
MIFLITILVIIILGFLMKSKNSENPFFIWMFNFIWICIYIIYLLNKSSVSLMNISETYVQFTISIFIISMNLGFLLFNKPVKNEIEGRIDIDSYVLNKNKFYVFLIVLFILLLIIYKESIPLVLSGNLGAIRDSIYGTELGSQGSLYSSGIESIFVYWFIDSMLIAIDIVLVSSYMKTKENFSVALFAILVTTTSEILKGGRMTILKAVIIILISLYGINHYRIFRFDKFKKSVYIRKRLNGFLIVILMLTLSVAIVTFVRNLSLQTDMGVFQTISVYLFSPIKYYNVLLDYNIPWMSFLYGGGFFGGILRIIYLIANNLGEFPFWYQFEQVMSVETSTFLEISPGQRYNAFPTMLYHFYRDGGVFGIIVDSLILTFIIMFLYKNYKQKLNLKSESFLLLSLYVLFFGSFRWEPGTYEPWFASLYIPILTSKLFLTKKMKKEESHD